MLIRAAILGLVTALAPAQTAAKPDFSGTWVIAQEQTNRLAGMTVTAMSLGREFTAKQDAATLTLERVNGVDAKTGNPTRVSQTYKLDGTETVVKTTPPGRAEVTTTTKASWDGAHLVLMTTATTEAPSKNEIKRVIWIDENGFLIVEATSTPPGVAPFTRNVYQKK